MQMPCPVEFPKSFLIAQEAFGCFLCSSMHMQHQTKAQFYVVALKTLNCDQSDSVTTLIYSQLQNYLHLW